jgi:chaperonin GroES
MTKIIPLDDRAVVKVRTMERKTEGGIILPDDYKDRHDMAQLEAEVVATGEFFYSDCEVRPKVGDTVLITKYAGLLYTVDDVEYRTVSPRDIVGILT